jgi:hypothetical protein
MAIVFETEKVGPLFRGLVVDLDTFQVIARTTTYASAEAAKSAAVSMWCVMQAQEAQGVAA